VRNRKFSVIANKVGCSLDRYITVWSTICVFDGWSIVWKLVVVTPFTEVIVLFAYRGRCKSCKRCRVLRVTWSKSRSSAAAHIQANTVDVALAEIPQNGFGYRQNAPHHADEMRHTVACWQLLPRILCSSSARKPCWRRVRSANSDCEQATKSSLTCCETVDFRLNVTSRTLMESTRVNPETVDGSTAVRRRLRV